MRIVLGSVAALLYVVSAASHAQAPPLKCATAKGIRTEVELKLVRGQKIYAMNVTFIGMKPSNKEVDRILRDCLAVAAKRDPSTDILGSPWFRKRPTDNQYDDELLYPYGGLKYIAYTASTKRIDVKDLEL